MQVREIVEEYRPARVLKTSPWSTVFLAADPRIGDEVVLKLIARGSPVAGEEEIERFHRVAEAVRSLPGASVPPIRDFGLTPDQSVFLVMDVVSGVDLNAWAAPQPGRAVPVLLQILGALEVLASAGVSHLNLRADNILISEQGQSERVRLLGFGTAAFLASVAGGVWPDPDAPEVPPELLPSAAVVPADGWRSDLFSFAVIACRLLGTEAEGAGGKKPRVVLSKGVAKGLGDTGPLISMLKRALNLDPMVRGESLANMRDALIRALPDEPADSEAMAVYGGEELSPYETFRVEPGELPEVALPVEPPTPSIPEIPRRRGDGPTLDGELIPAASAAPPSKPSETPPSPEKASSVAGAPSEPGLKPSAVPVSADSDEPARPAVPRSILLAATAVLAVVLLVIVTLILPRAQPAAPPEPVAIPTPVPTPEPTPEPELPPSTNPRLESAEALLMGGDAAGSRAAIQALRPEEIEAFTEDEAATYEDIRSALAGADRDRAIRDLRGGLEQGSVRMLRRGIVGVSAFSRAELRTVPGLERDLDRAREAMNAHNDLWAAEEAGDNLRVIELSAAVSALLPEYNAAYQLREQAAVAIRADAETAIEAGNYELAIVRLDSLQKARPGRTGVEERINWCREQVRAEQRQREILDEALAMGEAGNPEGGLRALAAAEPDSDWLDRYEEGRRRLETQLANLDAGHPIIELPNDFELAFRKNKTLVVPLSVTDDYRVERVVVVVKTESNPEYREIVLQDQGSGMYPFEVSPDLHGNAWVQFFVVATDHSGHETRLGGPQGPLTIQKKKWFQK